MSTRLLITPYASMSFSAVGSTHALIVSSEAGRSSGASAISMQPSPWNRPPRPRTPSGTVAIVPDGVPRFSPPHSSVTEPGPPQLGSSMRSITAQPWRRLPRSSPTASGSVETEPHPEAITRRSRRDMAPMLPESTPGCVSIVAP
jgi:hypothetical protein